MMTKKHYELIAHAVYEVYNYQKDSDGKGSRVIKQGAIRVTVENIAEALQRNNFNFNKDKFLTACGL